MERDSNLGPKLSSRSRLWAFLWLLLPANLAVAEPTHPPSPREARTEKAENTPPEVPYAASPYRVSLWIEFAPGPWFPSPFRAAVTEEFRHLANRLWGPVWELYISAPPVDLPFPTRASAPPLVDETHAARRDKTIWLRILAGGGGSKTVGADATIAAREFDHQFGEWGLESRKLARIDATLARSLFESAIEVFRPTALVLGRPRGTEITATVRGQGLMSANHPLPLVRPGDPFRVERETFAQGKRESRVAVPWTYLVYRGRADHGAASRFELTSALKNPLSARTRKKSRLVALGCGRAADGVTTVRFVNARDARPIVGFETVVQPLDQSAEISIGNTDHDGVIAIRPARLASERGPASPARVLLVTLRAGRTPLARFPLVPGLVSELTVRARLDPLLTSVNGQVLALQDEVVDVIARRSLLGRQLNKLAEKKDLARLKEVGDKINRLPDRAHFEARLQAIREKAEAESQAQKRAKLGTPIERLFLQTSHLLQQYFQTDKVTVDITEEPASEARPKGQEGADSPADAKANP